MKAFSLLRLPSLKRQSVPTAAERGSFQREWCSAFVPGHPRVSPRELRRIRDAQLGQRGILGKPSPASNFEVLLAFAGLHERELFVI